MDIIEHLQSLLEAHTEELNSEISMPPEHRKLLKNEIKRIEEELETAI